MIKTQFPRTVLPLLVCTMLGIASRAIAEPTTQPLAQTPAALFDLTSVWTVHLTFTAEQWQAMQPKNTGRGPFGQPGPGGPGPRRGPDQFGPANFLAPVFLRDGDRNHDQKLSAEEFELLAGKWFDQWDKSKRGVLNPEQLRDGLNATFGPPQGPGNPGGPGPRPPGMFLQGAEGQRNGLSSMMGLTFVYVRADLEFNGQTIKDVGIRYKGNGTFMESMQSIKKSLKIQTNHFVKGQKLAGISTLNLHNCVTDASWMNEVLSHKLFRDASLPAPRTAYARVYVTVPGVYDRKYFGLYSLVEDIDTNFTREHFGPKVGALFKPVTPLPFTDMGPNFDAYRQTYDPKTRLSEKETRRLIDFCRLVSHAEDAEFAAKLPEFLDLDNFSRFMATEVYLSTLDSILVIGQNYYVYLHPKTHKLCFMPWDLDHSFGQFPMIGNQEQREQLSIHHPWRGENRFLDRIFKVEAFKKLYLARLEEFSKTIFVPDRFHKQVDEIAAAIRPAVKEESAGKLARFDRVVAGQNPDGPGIADAIFGRGRGSMMPKRLPIKPFVIARTQSVLDQLAGKSQGWVMDPGGFGAPPPPRPPGDRPMPGNRGDMMIRGGPGPQPRPGGPADFLAPAFMMNLDSNKDRQLARDEFVESFGKWFSSWNTDHSGLLTEEQIRAGIAKTLLPPRPAPPDGPRPTPP